MYFSFIRKAIFPSDIHVVESSNLMMNLYFCIIFFDVLKAIGLFIYLFIYLFICSYSASIVTRLRAVRPGFYSGHVL
jgi:hypothetical protein